MRINVRELKSMCLLLITSIIWGLSFVSQVTGMDSMGPLIFNAIKFAIGAISLIPVVIFINSKQKKLVNTEDEEKKEYIAFKPRRAIPAGIICGLIISAASILQQVGIGFAHSAGRAGFITGLYIIITPIIGLFFKHKVAIFTWVACVLAVLGLYLLCVTDGFGMIDKGDIIVFVSAFFWAAHIIAIDKLNTRINPIHLAIFQFSLCSFLSFILAFIFEQPSLAGALDGWFALLFSGLFSAGIGFTLQIIGQRHVAPTKAALIMSLEAVFGVIGGLVFLGEIMSVKAYIGCVLIFAGIVLAQIPSKNSVASLESQTK